MNHELVCPYFNQESNGNHKSQQVMSSRNMSCSQVCLSAMPFERFYPSDRAAFEIDRSQISSITFLVAKHLNCKSVGQNLIGAWPNLTRSNGNIPLVRMRQTDAAN